VVRGVSDGIGLGASEELIHLLERVERVDGRAAFANYFANLADVLLRVTRRSPFHALAHNGSFAASAREVKLRVCTAAE
jgi:hypothetical protein